MTQRDIRDRDDRDARRADAARQAGRIGKSGALDLALSHPCDVNAGTGAGAGDSRLVLLVVSVGTGPDVDASPLAGVAPALAEAYARIGLAVCEALRHGDLQLMEDAGSYYAALLDLAGDVALGEGESRDLEHAIHEAMQAAREAQPDASAAA